MIRLWVLLLLAVPAYTQIAVPTGTCTAATTTCSLNAVKTGDLIISAAYVSGSTSVPTNTKFTSIVTGATGASGTTGAIAISCRKASSATDTSCGKWSAATQMYCAAYSGTGVGTTANCNTTGVGVSIATYGQSSTSIAFPALSLSKTNGSSWIVAVAGASAGVPGTASALTSRKVSGTAPAINGYDSNASLSSWSGSTASVTSGTWLSGVVEMVTATLAAPTFNLGTGSYTTSVSVTATIPTGSTGCYTTDGTAPAATTSGTCSTGTSWTSASGAITISTTGTTLKMIATEAGATTSAETDATYTINAAKPTTSEASGTYSGSVTVALSGVGAEVICYTTDGSTTPTASTPGICDAGSTTYTSPITITSSSSLWWIGTQSGKVNSVETQSAFTITAPAAPGWTSWNGATVGAPSSDISSMNGKTIGTSTGGYSSWNGLTYSASNGNPFGTVDVFVPMTGATVGSAVTTTNLKSGTYPSGYCSWTADTGPLVSASQGSLGGSVTINGITYPGNTSTTSVSLPDSDTGTIDDCALPSNNPVQSIFSYITPGPPIEYDNNSKLFDELMAETVSGGYAVVQLATGEVGPNPNFACSWNIETSTGNTVHSSYFPIPCGVGMRFGVTLEYNGTTGTAQADFYRPSDWAHLASIKSVTATGKIYGFRFGNNEYGANTGTTTKFEDVMEVSGTSPTYPLIPGVPKPVPTWGSQNSCSNTGSVTSLACAITPQGSNDGLLIQACTTAGTGTVLLTDTLGYSFNALDGPTNIGSWRCATFSVFGVSSSADTLTMHNSAGEDLIQIVDITGNPTGVDQHSGPALESSTTGGLYSTASLTTTHATEVGIGFSACSTNSCWAGSDYAEIGLDPNYLGSLIGTWYTTMGSYAAGFVDAGLAIGASDEAAFVTVY